MSFDRIWRWTCNAPESLRAPACPRVVEVHGLGLPRGWCWVAAGMTEGADQTTHRCSSCAGAEIERARVEKRAPVVHRPRDSYATDEPVVVGDKPSTAP